MPSLTLEQILARSMRMSRRRAPSQVAHLLAGQGGNEQKPRAASTAFGLRRGATGLYLDSGTDDPMIRWRTSLNSDAGILHNGVDLLSYLQSARQLGAWEDGLAAFLHATRPHGDVGITAPPTTPLSTSLTPSHTHKVHAGATQDRRHIRPIAAHVIALLDMLAEASQWASMQNIARYYATSLPDVVTHAATLLCSRPSSAAATSAVANVEKATTPRAPWRDAFDFVRSLPVAAVPLAAYNAVLAGCEGAVDWQGALDVFAALGCDPLQEPARSEGTAAGEGGIAAATTVTTETEATCVAHNAHAVGETAALPADGATQRCGPAQRATLAPDVVSYATLLATLEQAGQVELAARVLRQLPTTAREEITASYAALIYVWSKQSTSKRGPWRRY